MTAQASLSTSRDRTAVRELPPSAKLVAKTLEYEGDLTQSELAESTLLPDRTVRSAVRELEAADLVTSRISFADARQRVCSLVPDEL